MLEIGAVDQTVEVSGAAPLIESGTSDLGTVVDQKQVWDLPLSVNGNMRNPESFVFLAPGVTGDAANTEINGSQDRAKEVLVDGAQATGPESGGTIFTYPPVEAIGEFKLEAANFSAEYGKSGGGFEIFTTESGMNQFHGSVFEYLRNDQLDARGFISPITPVNRQSEFGAALGGPVLLPKYSGRNRTFFYFVYDGFRYRAGATNQVLTLPSAAQRNGDFSGLTKGAAPLAIYDPGTTVTDGAGGFTRTPFAGAKIPQSRFSKVSAAMLQLLPEAKTNAATANYTAVGAQTFDRNVFTIKGDHAFNDRNRVSLFVYISNEASIAAALIEGAMSPALNQQRPARWVRFNHDYQISPTMLNNFHAGYTREPQKWARVTSDQGLLQKIGLTGVNPPGDIVPRVQFADTYQNWSDETKNKGVQVNNTLQFGDSLALYRGNHNLKFGADMRWQQTNGADSAGQQGLFNFNSNETALPTAAGRASSGNAFASFLLGAVDNSSYNGLFVVPGIRYQYKALFAQDDWKISGKLTLNIGLRWDLFTPWREHNTNISGFDPALPNPGAGNLLGAIGFLGDGPGRDNSRQSFADTYYKAFGPRIGFAYQLAKNTVLRGGYGISYGQGNANAGLRDSQKFVYGFNAAPSYASTDAGVTPAFGWDAGFPTNWPKPPFVNPTVQNGTNVTMIGAGDGRPPMFQNYTFSVQQAISARTSIEAAYVGVKGTRLGNGLISINQVDPKYLSLGALLTQSVTSAAAQAQGIKVPYADFTGSVAQALRPYPQFLNIVNNSNPNGNSTYHALQVKLTKRLSHGLTVLGAYTWAKSLTDGNIAAGGGPAGQDFYHRRLEKSLSSNDVPQVFVLAYTWELPFGKGKSLLDNNGIVAHIVGGWQLSGIQQYSVGKPVQLTANNSLPIFNGVLRPNVIAATPMTLDHPDPLANPWFNKAAFAAPASYQFGAAARSYTELRAPNSYNESFGLMRQIKLTERTALVVRGEFFNTFNRVMFGAPVANVSASNFGRVTNQSNSSRRRLAAKAKGLGRRVLREIATIVSPETLLRWHRRLIAQKYDGSDKRSPGHPRTLRQVERLVVRLATENRDWGYRRILGALSNLGHTIGRGTVANILNHHGIEPAPERSRKSTWKEFLRRHWDVLVAADLFTVEVWTRSGLTRFLVLFLIDLSTRRVEIAGIATKADGIWMDQVARNLCDDGDGFLNGKRYLIHDRDPLFTTAFLATLATSGVKSVKLPPRSPNLNAYAERFVRTIKESCLDRMILLGEGSLRKALREFLFHYHGERNHQGLGNGLIIPEKAHAGNRGAIRRRERLGGMLNYYYRQAA